MMRTRCGVLLALSLGAASLTAVAQTCNPFVAAVAPNGRYADLSDGTVVDTQTGLMWKKCSEGMTWNGTSGTCGEAAKTYSWDGALALANNVNAGSAGEKLGHSDWRLPSVKELASLVERKCFNPAVNATYLLNTAADTYWSSSPFGNSSTYAWLVDFNAGLVDNGNKSFTHFVRLVRGGQ